MTNTKLIRWLFAAGFLLPFSAWVVLSVTSPLYGAELSVQPLLIETEQAPGTEVNFSFTVRSDEDARVRITPHAVSQADSGYMGFRELAADSGSSGIDLDDNLLELRANQPVEVSGTFDVPREARGLRLAALIIEEALDDEVTQGIRVSVRYAVILKAAITGRRYRETGTFGELELVPTADGLALSGLLTNSSEQDYRTESRIQIRNTDNRLIETVVLKSRAAWQKGESESWIFPGAGVQLFGPLKKLKEPGEYKLTIVHRLGKRGQIVRRETLTVEPELLPANNSTAEEQPSLVVAPATVTVEVRPDGTALSFVTLENVGSVPLRIKFPSEDESAGEVEFSFVPESIAVAPRRSKRVILRQKFENPARPLEQIYEARVMRPNGSVEVVSVITSPVTSQ